MKASRHCLMDYENTSCVNKNFFHFYPCDLTPQSSQITCKGFSNHGIATRITMDGNLVIGQNTYSKPIPSILCLFKDLSNLDSPS